MLNNPSNSSTPCYNIFESTDFSFPSNIFTIVKDSFPQFHHFPKQELPQAEKPHSALNGEKSVSSMESENEKNSQNNRGNSQ